MFRAPFVWETHVRRELLEEEIARLREVPYSLWQDVLRRPLRRAVRGRDNREYMIRTTADPAAAGSPNIRVTVALQTPMLRRRLLSQSFVITPDNLFRE